MNNESELPCRPGDVCRWTFENKSLGCSASLTPDYKTPPFLTAEESGFHDETLIEATRKMQEVIDNIPEDPDGRTLSLIFTDMGVLLAWVSHKGENLKASSNNVITSDDDNETVAKALGLTNAIISND